MSETTVPAWAVTLTNAIPSRAVRRLIAERYARGERRVDAAKVEKRRARNKAARAARRRGR